jgi:hypothetical protein
MEPLRRSMMTVVSHEEQLKISSGCHAGGRKHGQHSDEAEERVRIGAKGFHVAPLAVSCCEQKVVLLLWFQEYVVLAVGKVAYS